MGSTNVSKKWLITGASQGLGLATALAALKAGHRVLAGARDPAKAAKEHPEVERSGGQWLTLDVASLETQIIVRNAIEDLGGIDVVVNNAGYWHGGTIEDLTYALLHLSRGPEVLTWSVERKKCSKKSRSIISVQFVY